MSKFKKKDGNALPAISTASLPDIVFMLLFFFMVVTQLRDSELMVKVTTPYATQLTKLEEKTLVSYIYIGRPAAKYEPIYGTMPRMQLGDKFAKPEEIPFFLQRAILGIPESNRSRLTTSLRVDGGIYSKVSGLRKRARR